MRPHYLRWSSHILHEYDLYPKQKVILQTEQFQADGYGLKCEKDFWFEKRETSQQSSYEGLYLLSMAATFSKK